MKTKLKSFIRAGCCSFGLVCAVALVLPFVVLSGLAQTNIYLFTGFETNITLNPGLYDITAYGAPGGSGGPLHGNGGGLGAEMGGEFYFSATTTITLLVGGVGLDGGPLDSGYYYGAGGGGGGSFIVNDTIPLVVAGGGGGGGFAYSGSSGNTGTSGGGGVGLDAAAGGEDGGGGGFYLGFGGYTGGAGGGGYSGGGSGGYSDGGNSYLSGGVGGGGGGIGGDGGFGGGGGGYDGGGGGGGYSGGGGGGPGGLGGGGGGGGSIIDSSAITNLTEVSGIASPDDPYNGEIIVTAVPASPPTIECPAPLILECENGAAVGTVQVSVVDSNGFPVEVVWTVDGISSQTNYIPSGGNITESNVTFTASFGEGEHVASVSASNGRTTPATCSIAVTVRDTIPPKILRIVATPNKLWPPNHRLIPVNLVVDSEDNCDPSPVSKIIKVTSNEPENRFRTDWEITGPLSVSLRADSSGFGFMRERIYKIEIQCEDSNGNISYGSVEVPVLNDNERFLTPMQLR